MVGYRDTLGSTINNEEREKGSKKSCPTEVDIEQD
jgi:hypothetical protein